MKCVTDLREAGNASPHWRWTIPRFPQIADLVVFPSRTGQLGAIFSGTLDLILDRSLQRPRGDAEVSLTSAYAIFAGTESLMKMLEAALRAAALSTVTRMMWKLAPNRMRGDCDIMADCR